MHTHILHFIWQYKANLLTGSETQPIQQNKLRKNAEYANTAHFVTSIGKAICSGSTTYNIHH